LIEAEVPELGHHVGGDDAYETVAARHPEIDLGLKPALSPRL
jgi:hypothetical protein